MAAMAARRFDFSGYLKLVLTGSDIAGSYRAWLTQFRISVELTTLDLGDDGQGNPRFMGRTKLSALLRAIGCDGIETLQSIGFDLQSAAADAYDTALGLMTNQYEREESVYIRTMRFVTVAQASGEYESECLGLKN